MGDMTGAMYVIARSDGTIYANTCGVFEDNLELACKAGKESLEILLGRLAEQECANVARLRGKIEPPKERLPYKLARR